jgi:hypothetical protein
MPLAILIGIVAYLLIKSSSTVTTTGTPLKTAANTVNPGGGYVANTPNNYVALASAAGLVYDNLTGTYVNKNGTPTASGNAGNSGVSSANPNSISDPTANNDPNSEVQYDYGGNVIQPYQTVPTGTDLPDNSGITSNGVLLSDANSNADYSSIFGGW